MIGSLFTGISGLDGPLRLLGNACVPAQAGRAFQDLMARAS